MDLQLVDNVAVVIGSAQGIGLAIATEFAREGARVVLADVSPGVVTVAEQLSKTGAAVRSEIVDVTDHSAVTRCATNIYDAYGRVDHVVFAVGIGSGKFGFPYWNLDPSDWDRVLRVNLIGAANVAHTFGPKLANQKAGTMLLLSSVAGQNGSQTDPPYSAAKAGLINFMQCAAKDLAPYGVRVNALCPGMVQTPLNRSVWQAWADRQPHLEQKTYDDWAAEKIAKIVPLNRWQTPEDMAAMAVFLASKRAQNITGQTINVDGGYVMR